MLSAAVVLWMCDSALEVTRAIPVSFPACASWRYAMEKKPSSKLFWPVLAIFNVLAMSYPVVLSHQAVSTDAQLLATLLLLGCVFVLVVVDAVSILMAEEFDELKRGAKQGQRTWITTQK
jgi:hypothetical protein